MNEVNNNEIYKGLVATTTVLETLRQEGVTIKLELNTTSNKLSSLEEQTKRLMKVVIEGNGQKALSSRVLLLEDDIVDFKKKLEKDLEEEIKELKARVEILINLSNQREKEVVKQGWEIIKGLIPIAISAVIGLAGVGIYYQWMEASTTYSKEKTELYKRLEKNIDKLEKLK